ncbi:MAG: type II toxin-antitoxin system HicB family antitoxin [Prevotella sp.]|nr:type II toxin-antitoxin system HicB family antitoxin [Prevotella sp.]
MAYCKEEGIQPHKSYTGTLNVRISPETHSRIAMLAKKTGMSINGFIRQALDNQVAMMPL